MHCSAACSPSPPPSARSRKPPHTASPEAQQAALHARLSEAITAERWTDAEVLTRALIALDDPQTLTLRASLPHHALRRDIDRRLSRASLLASLASWQALDAELQSLAELAMNANETKVFVALKAQRPSALNPATPAPHPPTPATQTAPP